MYATLGDVQALNAARNLTATSVPNSSQVAQFLQFSGAQIDSILVEKGYSLPVPTTATAALMLLERVNAQGGYAMTERSAAASPHADTAEKAYAAALEMLEAASTILDIPKSVARSSPRGPGLTVPPGSVPAVDGGDGTFNPYTYTSDGVLPNAGAPFFSRRQQF